jgi:hypothetical protein
VASLIRFAVDACCEEGGLVQDMLDGDGAAGHDHVGTSEAGDLDEYLKELDAEKGDAGGAGNGNGAVDFGDVDEYLGELNLSDEEDGKEATDTPDLATSVAK